MSRLSTYDNVVCTAGMIGFLAVAAGAGTACAQNLNDVVRGLNNVLNPSDARPTARCGVISFDRTEPACDELGTSDQSRNAPSNPFKQTFWCASHFSFLKRLAPKSARSMYASSLSQISASLIALDPNAPIRVGTGRGTSGRPHRLST